MVYIFFESVSKCIIKKIFYIKHKISKTRDLFRNFILADALYNSSELLLIVFIPCIIFESIYAIFRLKLDLMQPVYNNFIISKIILVLILILASLAFTVEILKVLIKIFENPLGKFVFGFIFSASGIYISISTRHIINLITGVNPSSFPTALTILSIFNTIPYSLIVIFLLMYILYFISLFLGVMLIPFRSYIVDIFSINNINVLYKIFIRRMAGVASLTLLIVILVSEFSIFQAQILSNYSSLYLPLRNQFLPRVIVFSEYYSESFCENVKEKELVSFIDKEIISVAIEDVNSGYIFETRLCDKSNIKVNY